jgi:hypothetical protein
MQKSANNSTDIRVRFCLRSLNSKRIMIQSQNKVVHWSAMQLSARNNQRSLSARIALKITQAPFRTIITPRLADFDD